MKITSSLVARKSQKDYGRNKYNLLRVNKQTEMEVMIMGMVQSQKGTCCTFSFLSGIYTEIHERRMPTI